MKTLKAAWIFIAVTASAVIKVINVGRIMSRAESGFEGISNSTRYTCHGCGGVFEFGGDEPRLHYTEYEGESYVTAVLCKLCNTKYEKEA